MVHLVQKLVASGTLLVAALVKRKGEKRNDVWQIGLYVLYFTL
jgi:hypothetical protein